jgi:hypothetical protein
MRRAQDLLRHTIPNGDPALVVERALKLLADTLERTKLAAVRHPRPAGRVAAHSRHIPAAARREVWVRDAGRCAFAGDGGRCPERGGLELHHVIPFADGGGSDASNLQLRCRAHNAFEAYLWSDTSAEEVWMMPRVIGDAEAEELAGAGRPRVHPFYRRLSPYERTGSTSATDTTPAEIADIIESF